MTTKFVTAEDVMEVCEKHGWGRDSGKTGQALLSVDLDTVKNRSEIEDKLIEVGVLEGEKQFQPTVKDAYENGECPDCGETIPDDASSGDECANCGHVFWSDKDVAQADGDRFEVIVGNIGRIYVGNDEAEAHRLYNEYVEQSKSGLGRAGNETVVVMEDGEPQSDHDYYPPGYGEEDRPDEPNLDDGPTPQQAADEDFRRQHPHDGDSE